MAWQPLVPNHEPVFLNSGASRSELELKKLEALRLLVSKEDEDRLERDIRMTQAGISGEQKIIFELQNGHYPLIFIHDLCLEHNGTSAQIDFFVITPFNTLIIECKNLIGDIEIDESGAFIRTFGKGKYRRREGIYSPIAQNRRHIELIKAILRSSHGKLVHLIQHYTLDDFYHSVVVLANEKTVLSASSAPRDVRERVIRAEQLMDYIKNLDRRYARKNGRVSYKEMTKRADRWLSSNTPHNSDLTSRYKLDGQRRPEVADASKKQAKTVSPAPSPTATSTPSPTPESPAASRNTPAPRGTSTFGTAKPQPEATAPTCPLCGAPMVKRVARYGPRKGQSFFGCSNYGKNRCRGIINIEMRG